VLVRDKSASGYDLALVTTDLNASPAQVIERYAARWSIEVAIEDAKQEFGAGQARNRTPDAVRRTVPFQLACQAIAACGYATAGHDPADIEERRAAAQNDAEGHETEVRSPRGGSIRAGEDHVREGLAGSARLDAGNDS
jgi:hypothetical protein